MSKLLATSLSLGSGSLRLYGFNLSRGFRNAPHQACADALMQIVMLIALPLWVVLCLLASVLRGSDSSFTRRVFRLSSSPPSWYPAHVLDGQAVQSLQEHPGCGERFCSTRERCKSVSVFALVLLLIVAVAELFHSRW